MPEFEIVPLREAQIRTMSSRQGRFMNEYADYIQQLPQGQAGKLRPAENEKPATIRRRLVSAANALGIALVIRCSGDELYFWIEPAQEAQPRRRRPRLGSSGGALPLPDQPFSEPENVARGVTEEESPELGQTEQVVTDATETG
jgi:hypothetical protein